MVTTKFNKKEAEIFEAGKLAEHDTITDLVRNHLADLFPSVNFRYALDGFIHLKNAYTNTLRLLESTRLDARAEGRSQAAETIREMLNKALNSPAVEGGIEANIKLLTDERDDAIRQIRVMREALAVRDQFDRHAAMMLRLAASTDMTHAQREGVFKFLSAYMETLIGKRNGYDLPPPLPPDTMNEIPF